MVRLSDLHPEEAEHLRSWPHTQIEPGEWITPKPLRESTIALITTAGLHRRDDVPFASGAVDYRIIPGDVDFADVISTHLSSNWDRAALAQDLNVVLPIERLRELAAAGEIGGVARWHYSFMGGVPRAERLEPYAREGGGPAQARWRGRCRAGARLTGLHARRRRARPLHRA